MRLAIGPQVGFVGERAREQEREIWSGKCGCARLVDMRESNSNKRQQEKRECVMATRGTEKAKEYIRLTQMEGKRYKRVPWTPRERR